MGDFITDTNSSSLALANANTAPCWSVMIPTYRPKEKYLRRALESVCQQGIGSKQMQIEVVDDCSPGMDVVPLVKSIAGERITVSQTPRNLGLAGCWNICIERSLGQMVHILHQDDFVLPGFYHTIGQLADQHSEIGLFATRSFYVDRDGVITGVTGRLKSLECGGRTVDHFFYEAPVQCSGVVVRRNVYERYGVFRADLPLALDCEMWTRVIDLAGGLVSPEVLSCFRKHGENESDRLARSAEGLHDLERLHEIFIKRHPSFDRNKARRVVCNEALGLYEHFSKSGEFEAARANLAYWRKNAPLSLRLHRFAGKMARKLFK